MPEDDKARLRAEFRKKRAQASRPRAQGKGPQRPLPADQENLIEGDPDE